MDTKLIEYFESSGSYTYTADSFVLLFSPGPTSVQKSCTTEWRVGKGSVSDPEQRTRYRGPQEETYTISGKLPHTGSYSVQSMEKMSRRNSKWRLETPLVSPKAEWKDTMLDGAFATGAKTLKVYDTTNLLADDWIQIGEGSEQMEVKKIASIPGSKTIVLSVALGHDHLDQELVEQLEPVFVIIEGVDLRQEEVKMTTYEGAQTELIEYTIKLRRVRDNDCTGE